MFWGPNTSSPGVWKPRVSVQIASRPHTTDFPQKAYNFLEGKSPTISGKSRLVKYDSIWPEYMVDTTVDGRNLAPPGVYKAPVNNGINYLSTGAGFLPSTVVHMDG